MKVPTTISGNKVLLSRKQKPGWEVAGLWDNTDPPPRLTHSLRRSAHALGEGRKWGRKWSPKRFGNGSAVWTDIVLSPVDWCPRVQATMSQLRDDYDPYAVEEPSDEEPALSRWASAPVPAREASGRG